MIQPPPGEKCCLSGHILIMLDHMNEAIHSVQMINKLTSHSIFLEGNMERRDFLKGAAVIPGIAVLNIPLSSCSPVQKSNPFNLNIFSAKLSLYEVPRVGFEFLPVLLILP